MASERQIQANRRNARKSTGPRSEAGKRRAGRNALKYGLSIANKDIAEIDKLAAKIAGPAPDLEVLECSWIIAAAEIDLRRVRRVRSGLFEGVASAKFPERSSEKPLNKMPSILGDLRRVQRYEQGAMARRDKALRRLLLLKTKRRRLL